VNLFAQSDNKGFLFFVKVDSTYVMVDNNKGHGFMLEFKADTLFQIENNMIVYDNRKLLQVNVIPFSEVISNPKKNTTIPKALEAFKKWELDYQQKVLKTKLKSGQEFYYRDNNKPFLIWWHQNPPEEKKNKSDYNEKEYDPETDTFVEVKTLNVTHMLFLNFSILAEKNVAITIPVFEDEDLNEEIEKMKEIANSVRVYGSGILDIGVLMDIKKSKEKYVLRDSLNFLELEVPDWVNVLRPMRDNAFFATFPERYEVINAIGMYWEYKSDSLTFNNLINRNSIPKEKRPNYRLLEESDSVLRYFYTSDNGWYYQQDVYLRGENVYCFFNFTATRNTYDYNIGRFEEIIKKIKLK
jgi:hypothetical protein